MVNHFGYCPSLRKKVDFAVSEIVDIPTSRGMKYQIKGNFEGRLCNTFCSATKAAELRTQIGSPKIYTVMEAEESQENLGQATQEESVPAIIGPSQKAYGQEGEAAEALPIAQTMPTPIISADDMSIQPIDDLSLPDATIQDMEITLDEPPTMDANFEIAEMQPEGDGSSIGNIAPMNPDAPLHAEDFDAEESQENLGQATQEESVPAIIGPSQEAYGQEGEAAQELPIAQTVPTPIISAVDMNVEPIDNLSSFNGGDILSQMESNLGERPPIMADFTIRPYELFGQGRSIGNIAPMNPDVPFASEEGCEHDYILGDIIDESDDGYVEAEMTCKICGDKDTQEMELYFDAESFSAQDIEEMAQIPPAVCFEEKIPPEVWFNTPLPSQMEYAETKNEGVLNCPQCGISKADLRGQGGYCGITDPEGEEYNESISCPYNKYFAPQHWIEEPQVISHITPDEIILKPTLQVEMDMPPINQLKAGITKKLIPTYIFNRVNDLLPESVIGEQTPDGMNYNLTYYAMDEDAVNQVIESKEAQVNDIMFGVETFEAPKSRLSKKQQETLDYIKESTMRTGRAYITGETYNMRVIRNLFDKKLIKFDREDNQYKYNWKKPSRVIENDGVYYVVPTSLGNEYTYRFPYGNYQYSSMKEFYDNQKPVFDGTTQTLDEVLDELFGAESFSAENKKPKLTVAQLRMLNHLRYQLRATDYPQDTAYIHIKGYGLHPRNQAKYLNVLLDKGLINIVSCGGCPVACQVNNWIAPPTPKNCHVRFNVMEAYSISLNPMADEYKYKPPSWAKKAESFEAESKKKSSKASKTAEKAILTGASTGATMEIADALLAAESFGAETFEDSCPICGEEIFDSMEYGMMGYNIAFCDNCDLDMHTCKGSCKCRDTEGKNTIPIGNVFCDCGFGQVHGSRTPCASCEPISEKIENHNTKMNAAETFEADDGWVKSTASERISGYPSFLRKKLFQFEKQFTMPPYPNTLKIDVDGYFTGISYEDADESYFNTPEFIDERKEFVEIYTDPKLQELLEKYTMNKVKNYYEEIEWVEGDGGISYCDDYFKEQMNDYMSDWSYFWMGESNIDRMGLIRPTFLPTHIKFVDETRGITIYEYNNKGKSIESYDAEGVHPCGCGFGPEGYEGDIESYPCDNYPDCAEGRRYQQLQEELRQMRRLADEKRQHRQTLIEIAKTTQSKGELEWADLELKKLNENRAESFEAPRGWGGRMSQKRRWNDNHVVWASDSKLVRQALKEQFPDYKFGVSIIDGQYIQVVVKSGDRPANLDLFREEVETAAMKPIEEAYEDLPEELGDKSVYVMFYDSDFNAESFNVEFDDWADQEMKSHGENVSFKKWAKEEGEKHGDVPITDWAEHEEESHDERYGAEEGGFYQLEVKHNMEDGWEHYGDYDNEEDATSDYYDIYLKHPEVQLLEVDSEGDSDLIYRQRNFDLDEETFESQSAQTKMKPPIKSIGILLGLGAIAAVAAPENLRKMFKR